MDIYETTIDERETYSYNRSLQRIFRIMEGDQWLEDKTDEFKPGDWYTLPPRPTVLIQKGLATELHEAGIDDAATVLFDTVRADVAELLFSPAHNVYDVAHEWQLSDGDTYKFTYSICVKPECVLAFKDLDLATGGTT